jgi:DGQHR domain-containing protein
MRKQISAPKKGTPKRLAKGSKHTIERRALRVPQSSGRDLFLLVLSPDEILKIADISRVSRDDNGKLLGYQRPEVKRHVDEIVRYLDSDEMIFAHPLILSLSSTVKFVSSRGQKTSDGLAASGTLFIPLSERDGRKPAWIVDGQQRALAISRCNNRDFAVPVCAFVADEVETQRDQFLRINNSRPLPRGLITELLPEISSSLPPKLSIRKVPSAFCDLLNREKKSPFFNLIRRSSTPLDQRTKTVITDTVIVGMIEESLTHTSGCLFPFRNVATGECDNDGIWEVLFHYWTGVKDTFPDAWGKPATQSRLMHGVGIRAMGKLMDRVMTQVDCRDRRAPDMVRSELAKVAPRCRWTNGVWEDLDSMPWNAFQNVSKHISLLSNYLIRTYLERR